MGEAEVGGEVPWVGPRRELVGLLGTDTSVPHVAGKWTAVGRKGSSLGIPSLPKYEECGGHRSQETVGFPVS